MTFLDRKLNINEKALNYVVDKKNKLHEFKMEDMSVEEHSTGKHTP